MHNLWPVEDGNHQPIRRVHAVMSPDLHRDKRYPFADVFAIDERAAQLELRRRAAAQAGFVRKLPAKDDAQVKIAGSDAGPIGIAALDIIAAHAPWKGCFKTAYGRL